MGFPGGRVVKHLPANAGDSFYSQAAQAWEKIKVFIIFPCILSGLFLNPQVAFITKAFLKETF